jgi:hypothetical protein
MGLLVAVTGWLVVDHRISRTGAAFTQSGESHARPGAYRIVPADAGPGVPGHPGAFRPAPSSPNAAAARAAPGLPVAARVAARAALQSKPRRVNAGRPPSPGPATTKDRMLAALARWWASPQPIQPMPASDVR